MQATHKNRTHLFTLRLWAERVDRGECEFRFKVRHVLSGEVRYFRDWLMLIDNVMIMVVQTMTSLSTGFIAKDFALNVAVN